MTEPMCELEGLVTQYLAASSEYGKPVDLAAPPNTGVDICAHLHHEVSEPWDVLRGREDGRLKERGYTREEGAVERLGSILAVWLGARELIVPEMTVDEICRAAAEVIRRSAGAKFGRGL